MKTTIDVENRREADAIKIGLDDPVMRAMVMVTGVLVSLSERDQAQVMGYISERFGRKKDV